jgi:Ser/Thr protein kinase RdoA (MazF antagonist)
MMKLATLWMVDRTVDGAGRSPIATELFRRWSNDGEARMLRASANFVYTASHRGEPCVLRFAHASERSREQIEQEMRLLRWLDRAGVPVNLPVASRGGQLVETVETDLGLFHAVVLIALPGEHLEIGHLALPEFETWGATVGRLHACFNDLPEDLRRAPAWPDVLTAAATDVGPSAGLLARESTALERDLARMPLECDVYGPIHTDLELDNLLWNGNRFGLVDFDEYSTSWRAADIAKALNDLFDLRAGLDDPRLQAFVAGYRRHLPLGDETLAALPFFTRLFDLGMYLRLQRALADPLDADGERRLAALIGRLRAWMERYERRTSAFHPV